MMIDLTTLTTIVQLVQGESGGVLNKARSWLDERKRRGELRVRTEDFIQTTGSFDEATKAHFFSLLRNDTEMRRLLNNSATKDEYLSALRAIEGCLPVESERVAFRELVETWARTDFFESAPRHARYQQSITENNHEELISSLKRLENMVIASNATRSTLAQGWTGEHRELAIIRQYLRDGAVDLARKKYALLPQDFLSRSSLPQHAFDYLIVKGTLLRYDGDTDGAAASFEAAQDYDHQSPRAVFHLGYAQYLRKQYAEAERTLETIPIGTEAYDGAQAIRADCIAHLGRRDELSPLRNMIGPDQPELAVVLLRDALNAGELETGTALAHRLIAAGSGDARIRMLLAHFIYERLAHEASRLGTPFLHGDTLERSQPLIQEALAMATHAVDEFETTEQLDFRFEAYNTRQGIYMIADRPEEALEDGRRALEVNGSRDAIRRNQILICTRLERHAEVVQHYQAMRGTEWLTPNLLCLVAEAMHATGQHHEAEGTAVAIVSDPEAPSEDRSYALLILTRSLHAQGRSDEASLALASAPDALRDQPLYFLALAEGARRSGETGAMRGHYDAALRTSPEPFMEAQIRAQFGADLHREGVWGEAVLVWTPLLQPAADVSLLERFADAAFHAGSVSAARRAIALLEVAKHTMHPSLLHRDAIAAYDAGDLDRALARFEHLTTSHPEDATYAVQCAAVYERRREPESARRELERAARLPQTPETLGNASQLWFMLGEPEIALDRAYQALRADFDDRSNHERFIQVVLESREPPAQVDVVARETAVLLRFDDGRESWYFITADEYRSRVRQELHPSDPLAKRLLGQEISTRVVFDDRPVPPIEAEIVELRDKILHAFRTSTERFGNMFPGSGAFRMIEFDPNDADAMVETLLQVTASSGTIASEVNDLVNRLNLPRVTTAHLEGHDVIEWVQATTSDGSVPKLVTTFHQDEMRVVNAAVNAPRVAVMIDALLVLHRLGLLDTVRQRTRMLVPRHTVEVLEFRRKTLEAKGPHHLLGSTGDGRLSISEVGSDFILAQCEEINALLGFIGAHVEIVPVTHLGEIDPERRKALDAVFPQHVLATLYAAQEHGIPLLAEDYQLRRMAWGELPGQVPGFASVHLVYKMLKDRHMSMQSFIDALCQLADWHVQFLPITDAVMNNALRLDGFTIGERCTALLHALGRLEDNLPYQIRLVASVARSLWTVRKEDAPEQFGFVLNAVFGAHGNRTTADAIAATLTGSSRWNVDMMDVIERWSRQSRSFPVEMNSAATRSQDKDRDATRLEPTDASRDAGDA
jgi:tetratricopeptide (TPR) repeat protein